jgi:hypothetical protein
MDEPMVCPEAQKVIFSLIAGRQYPRCHCMSYTQYGKSSTVAGAVLLRVITYPEKWAIVAPSQPKAQIIMRKIFEFCDKTPEIGAMLEMETGEKKGKRLLKEASKKRVVFKNGGEIFVLSADNRNKAAAGEALMGFGSPNVVLDESSLINDEVYAKIFRMLGGSADNFIFEIGNPFNRNHFLDSWNNDKYYKINIDWRQGVKEGRITREFVEEMREKFDFGVMYDCKFPEEDSLDKEGLILANQGETLEDYLKKIEKEHSEITFLPDDDNIIPVLDDEWFEDDIAGLFREFLKVSFGKENLEKNMAFVEECIGKDMRKYFVKDFYADHIKRYKKRPIYWMFSSPKGSFNVLIYMHRYTPDTLNQILNGYLKEYKEKLNNELERLDNDIETGSSTEQSKAIKKKDKLKIILLELQEYEREILYPLATERIKIDLDDGVLVNYNKFGEAIKKVAGLNDKKAKDKVRNFDWINVEEIR